MTISNNRIARGFSLIEVMIAVIVLSVGLLALAALQGELFRSGAEAKARANAATIAQQVIEDARTFGFLIAPNSDYEDAGYNTYDNLATSDWEVLDVDGVDFTVNREVVRYRFDGDSFEPNTVDDYSVSVPEFKLVRVSVSWTDSNGNDKSVLMTDSIAAISPSDVTKVMEGPSEAVGGPQVWIEPPNLGNPRVIPIAVGDDQSAASSNPTPEQFIEDVSTITQFSVMSFTGDAADTEVRLSRKMDVAVASCVCQTGGTSSATNPAYKPTIWNGIQLAYIEPETMPVGTEIGLEPSGNAAFDSDSDQICTICCRDHFNKGDRSPLPDPWRASVAGDQVYTKYGYPKEGNAYNVTELLSTSQTSGLYVDACQLTRVNGRMRLMVDADQTALLTTSLNDDADGYRITDFADTFSDYVTRILTDGLAAGLPDGYPSASAKFPGPSADLDEEAAFVPIVDPDPIHVESGDKVELVTFGIYVDYLSDDTLLAYNCALEGDNEGDCAGLGNRAPLDVIPFYAVNVASLGDWRTESSSIATVQGPGYNNQGTLTQVGGVTTGGNGSSALDGDGEPIPTPVTLKINPSNSGLAGTSAVDLHDEIDANYREDAQGFTAGDGVDPEPPDTTNFVNFSVVKTFGNLGGFTVAMSPAIACLDSNQKKSWSCEFASPAPGTTTVTFSNYQKVNGAGTLQTDRKICVPPNAGVITGRSNTNSGLANETSTLTFSNLAAQDYTFQIDVINQTDTCTSGLVEAKFP